MKLFGCRYCFLIVLKWVEHGRNGSEGSHWYFREFRKDYPLSSSIFRSCAAVKRCFEQCETKLTLFIRFVLFICVSVFDATCLSGPWCLLELQCGSSTQLHQCPAKAACRLAE